MEVKGAEASEQAIRDLEHDIKGLERDYELYFQGALVRAPLAEQSAFGKTILRLKSQAGEWPTRVRFKLNTLHQKFKTLSRKWDRTMEEIERGTYKRHRARLKRKQAGEPRRTPARGRGKAQGLSDERIEQLFRTYLKAKARVGESTSMTQETMAKQLRQKLPRLREKFQCKQVDFKIVLKNGKTMIKPVPKK